MWAITKRGTAIGYDIEDYSLVEILLCGHIQIEVIQTQCEVKDVIANYRKQKFCWAELVTRFTDKWILAVIKWYLRD